MALDYYNTTGINSYQNPLQTDGQLIHAVNVVNFPQGGMSKRGGYTSFLNNPDSNQVNALFAFPHQDGTTIQLYRASGSLLYYSLQGTANWATAQGSAGTDAGGTILNGNYVDSAILNNVCIIADGGTVRHTTNGTQFSNTVNAPLNSQYVTQYNQRIYASDGTSSNLTYSSYGSADNWLVALPADSSSFFVPDEGAITKTFVAGDRLTVPKNKGKMFIWDTLSLVDMSTAYGPTAPKAIKTIDDYWFYINQLGIFGFDGANKNVISNPIQRQFYNRLGLGISSSNFGNVNSSNAVAATYLWDYLVAVGNVTDDFVGRKISNALIKYDYQKDTFVNWQFHDFPTAMLSYKDYQNNNKLIFGNAQGQCFQYDITKTSDNGNPISTEMIFLFTYASQGESFTQTSASSQSGQSWEKRWKWLRAFFTPGCEINCQFSFSNSLDIQRLRWSETINTKIGDGDYWQFSDGALEIRFPNDTNNLPRSRFLFVRYYESSDSSQYSLYGQQVDADVQTPG